MSRPASLAKTVLVVEDDPWTQTLLTELLADEGYQVMRAASGLQALQLARSRPPDVIVLDLNLPGKSGLDVLRELRANEHTATIPVIVVSGAVDSGTRALLARRPQRANRVMEKPLAIIGLFEQVEQATWV
jgi:CheY-like chemotaxis protein